MNANDRQEGGSHYATADNPQHWDLAIMYGWDPFQYQITKYVMRWKDKHDTPEKRLIDLKKARHFLDKYIENYDKYDSGAKQFTTPLPDISGHTEDLTSRSNLEEHIRKIQENFCAPCMSEVDMLSQLGMHQNDDWGCEGHYGDSTSLYRCRHCRELIRTKDLSHAEKEHGACAGPGYVAQG